MKDFLRDLSVVVIISFLVYGIAFLIYRDKDLPSATRTDTNMAQVKQDVNDPNLGPMRPLVEWTDSNAGW